MSIMSFYNTIELKYSPNSASLQLYPSNVSIRHTCFTLNAHTITTQYRLERIEQSLLVSAVAEEATGLFVHVCRVCTRKIKMKKLVIKYRLTAATAFGWITWSHVQLLLSLSLCSLSLSRPFRRKRARASPRVIVQVSQDRGERRKTRFFPPRPSLQLFILIVAVFGHRRRH